MLACCITNCVSTDYSQDDHGPVTGSSDSSECGEKQNGQVHYGQIQQDRQVQNLLLLVPSAGGFGNAYGKFPSGRVSFRVLQGVMCYILSVMILVLWLESL